MQEIFDPTTNSNVPLEEYVNRKLNQEEQEIFGSHKVKSLRYAGVVYLFISGTGKNADLKKCPNCGIAHSSFRFMVINKSNNEPYYAYECRTLSPVLMFINC